MQELRLVAVSEDGTYAVLAVPGRGGRFSLPIDDRLRTVAKRQFSRLAQYEIEVENPLRPKEIQDRIRAGETADEIADAAGIPIDRIRRFEGPVLAEREYRAQEAQRSTVRGHTESGPGPRLGEIVLERLADAGASTELLAWDSRKRPDGNWQVQLQFNLDNRPQLAEWVFDQRRRQVIPADDLARRLCLPQVDWPPAQSGGTSATVTPIASRLSASHGGATHSAINHPSGATGPGRREPDPFRDPRPDSDRVATRGAHAAPSRSVAPPLPLPATSASAPPASAAETRPRGGSSAREPGWGRDSAAQAGPTSEPARDRTAGEPTTAAPDSRSPAPPARTSESAAAAPAPAAPAPTAPAASNTPATGGNTRPAASPRPGDAAADDAAPPTETTDKPSPPRGRKAAKGRRASVPSWDEIMLGNSRQPD